ncbi:hypothetical protein DTO271D3_8651 [Paecilomyces variotii]|nr:hypothetical protein DTO271D3_8651 [Paecilomyces variotii]
MRLTLSILSVTAAMQKRTRLMRGLRSSIPAKGISVPISSDLRSVTTLYLYGGCERSFQVIINARTLPVSSVITLILRKNHRNLDRDVGIFCLCDWRGLFFRVVRFHLALTVPNTLPRQVSRIVLDMTASQ